MFSIKENGKYSFSNDVFLIANKTDIFKSQLGEDVKALEQDNIENVNFSSGSRWMSLKNIKKSMEENRKIVFYLETLGNASVLERSIAKLNGVL
jgi:hypothetical protein